MFNIAICDNDILFLEEISQFIESIFLHNNIPGQIELFCDPSEIISATEINPSKFDIYILDLEMPSMDGYSLLRKIRRYNNTSPAIAISSHLQYCHEDDNYKITTFIHKSRLDGRLERSIVAIFEDNLRNCALIHTSGCQVRVNLNQISYIEKTRKYCEIHLENGQILPVQNTLQKLIQDLHSNFFIQVNKSVYANIQKFQTINAECLVLDNGTNLKIGRRYRHGLRMNFLKYWKERVV